MFHLDLGAEIGAIKQLAPNTNRILATLDPKTFANAMAEFPFELALMETNNSGKLVPIAITVSPIKRSEIPR